MVFAYFVLPTPPLSVGAGLGNQPNHVWHRTHFRSVCPGLGGLWRISCYFPHHPANPPPAREPGSIWIKLPIHTGAQDRLSFGAILSLFLRHFLAPPPLRGDTAMAFVDDLFLSHSARPSFIYFFFGVPCRLRNLAVQGCGSGF